MIVVYWDDQNFTLSIVPYKTNFQYMLPWVILLKYTLFVWAKFFWEVSLSMIMTFLIWALHYAYKMLKIEESGVTFMTQLQL